MKVSATLMLQLVAECEVEVLDSSTFELGPIVFKQFPTVSGVIAAKSQNEALALKALGDTYARDILLSAAVRAMKEAEEGGRTVLAGEGTVPDFVFPQPVGEA